MMNQEIDMNCLLFHYPVLLNDLNMATCPRCATVDPVSIVNVVSSMPTNPSVITGKVPGYIGCSCICHQLSVLFTGNLKFHFRKGSNRTILSTVAGLVKPIPILLAIPQDQNV